MKQIVLLLFVCCFFCSNLYSQSLLNSGFESWSPTSNDTIPTGWYTSFFGSGQATDSHTGNYAVSLWNWYYYAKGVLCNGAQIGILHDIIRSGTAYNQQFNYVSGYYKYVLGDNGGKKDSALVIVLGRKYNPATQINDTVVFGVGHLGPTNEYTPFSFHLDQKKADLCDTVCVAFFSSDSGFCDVNTSTGMCCYLTVDDVSLSFVSGVKTEQPYAKYSPTPNPSRENISFGIAPENGCTLVIYDVSGVKRLMRSFPTNELIHIGNSGLGAGIYYYEMLQPNAPPIRGKFIRL